MYLFIAVNVYQSGIRSVICVWSHLFEHMYVLYTHSNSQIVQYTSNMNDTSVFFLHSGSFCKTPLTCLLSKPRIGSSIVPQQNGTGPDVHLAFLRGLRCVRGGQESAYVSQQPHSQRRAMWCGHGHDQVGDEWGEIGRASGHQRQSMSGQRESQYEK